MFSYLPFLSQRCPRVADARCLLVNYVAIVVFALPLLVAFVPMSPSSSLTAALWLSLSPFRRRYTAAPCRLVRRSSQRCCCLCRSSCFSLLVVFVAHCLRRSLPSTLIVFVARSRRRSSSSSLVASVACKQPTLMKKVGEGRVE